MLRNLQELQVIVKQSSDSLLQSGKFVVKYPQFPAERRMMATVRASDSSFNGWDPLFTKAIIAHLLHLNIELAPVKAVHQCMNI